MGPIVVPTNGCVTSSNLTRDGVYRKIRLLFGHYHPFECNSTPRLFLFQHFSLTHNRRVAPKTNNQDLFKNIGALQASNHVVYYTPDHRPHKCMPLYPTWLEAEPT